MNDYQRDYFQIYTKRLLLRHFQPGDEDCFFTFLSDRTSCWMDGGYEPYPEKNEAFYRLIQELSAQKGRYLRVEKESGTAVGTLRLWNTDTPGQVEVGYVMSPQYRRRGYASEALSALMQVAFAMGDAEVFSAEVFDYNPISAALLEKLGFRQVGQEIELLRSGESRTSLRYEYTRGE
jgi:RimJ/RimL family protein N-acetyltransferase